MVAAGLSIASGSGNHPARIRAKELLADPKCAGVRIIRIWKRPDGVTVDTEIFCEIREFKDDDTVRITPVDSVTGKCQTLKDFVGFRQPSGDVAHIPSSIWPRPSSPPTEIIYNLRHLKRISEKDGLVRAAVDMVATLQTREGEQDMTDRRTEIYQAIDEMVEHARMLDPASLPRLDRKFSEVMGSLGRGIDRDQRHYLIAGRFVARPKRTPELGQQARIAVQDGRRGDRA